MTRVHGMMVVAAAGMLVVGAMVVAGPLNPPGGAIAPTGKTLQEIFDKPSGDGRIAIAGGTTSVVISQPGSYVLTGDIVSEFAMQISAPNVTLDLNGYHLTSTVASSVALSIGAGLSNVTVRNGAVEGGVNGIAVGSGPTGLLIEDVTVLNAKANGISVAGSTARSCVLRRCRVIELGSTTTATDTSPLIIGINLSGTGNRVEDCTVSRMIYNGMGTPLMRAISVGGSGNVIDRCLVVNDTALSATGINAPGAVYRQNTVSNFTTPYSGGTDGGGNF